MHRVSSVRVLEGYRVELTFDDGVKGIVDLAGLAGKGVFWLWRDRRFFERVTVGPSGELAWDEQIDLCPDALYLRVTGREPGEVFPALRGEPSRA